MFPAEMENTSDDYLLRLLINKNLFLHSSLHNTTVCYDLKTVLPECMTVN